MKITETKQKTSEILAECRKLFNIWSFYDDKILDKNFPPPKEITTREFKDNQEADEEFANMSANDLKEKGIEGITLRERLLMEIQYFKKTGKHLDEDNMTLCSGSRDSFNGVPFVCWSHVYRGLCVNCYYPSYSVPHLRARAVVSNPSILNSCSLPEILTINNVKYIKQKMKQNLIDN